LSNNYLEEEQQAERIRADGLREKALKLGQEDNIKGAIHLMTKALQIYLHAGAYLEVVDVFDLLLINFATSESQILQIMERIRKTIDNIEYLNLPEISAKLKLALANFAFKTQDYLTAGNAYIETADLMTPTDAIAGAMILIRAAEAFEKLGRTERAEKLVFDAILKFNASNFDLDIQSKAVRTHIHEKKFQEAISILRETAKFFRDLEQELENSLEGEDEKSFKNIKNNVEARLIHMVSEYNLIKMMCFKHLNDETMVLQQAKKSVRDLIHAIQIIKEEIKTGYFSTGDLHRLTFDLFLLQMFQEFGNYQVEDPIDLVSRGLPAKVIEIVRKMKFYEYTVHVLEFDLRDSAELFEDMALSQILDPYRAFMIKSLKL